MARVDQAGLRAVVQIALDAAQVGGGRVDDHPPVRLQLGDPPLQLVGGRQQPAHHRPVRVGQPARDERQHRPQHEQRGQRDGEGEHAPGQPDEDVQHVRQPTGSFSAVHSQGKKPPPRRRARQRTRLVHPHPEQRPGPRPLQPAELPARPSARRRAAADRSPSRSARRRRTATSPRRRSRSAPPAGWPGDARSPSRSARSKAKRAGGGRSPSSRASVAVMRRGHARQPAGPRRGSAMGWTAGIPGRTPPRYRPPVGTSAHAMRDGLLTVSLAGPRLPCVQIVEQIARRESHEVRERGADVPEPTVPEAGASRRGGLLPVLLGRRTARRRRRALRRRRLRGRAACCGPWCRRRRSC